MWGAVAGLACILSLATPLASSSAAATEATISTIAGTGTAGYSGDGGPAVSAQLNEPRGIAVTSDGAYLIAEPYNHVVRRVAPGGTISTVAGTGISGFSGDGGPATAARVDFVHGASPTPDGGYLIADTLNNRIRKVLPDGSITTVAGNGGQGYSGDGGPATAAMINVPRGVAALSDGGILIPDTNNHRIRKVSAGGVITTVAGTGVQGFSGDGAQATAARLSIPFSVSPTADGGFLIVDVGNQRIRKVSPNGKIDTVAGTGVGGFSGDGGPATSAAINSPANVQAAPGGGFVIADSQNQRVRFVDANGVISTIAGTGVAGYNGEGGAATASQLNIPKDALLTPGGDVLIADAGNYRLRRIGPPVAPSSIVPPAITGVPEAGQILTATSGSWAGTPPLTFTYQWRRCDGSGNGCTDVSGATGSSYTLSAGDVGTRIRVQVTASNGGGSTLASSAASGVVAAAGTAITTTIPVSGSGEDGDVTREDVGGVYPPGGAFYSDSARDVVFVRKGRPSWGVSVMVGLVRFDTGVLPDNAVVTSASLRLRLLQKVGVNNPSLVAEWYGAANWPIESGDWAAAVGTDAHAGTAWAGLVANADNDLSLQNLGSISLTGATGLRLGLSGGSPTGDNYLSFASWDHASLAEPRLLVTYTLPGAGSPVASAPPVVSGTAGVGEVLSASTGTWSNSPTGYAYRWERADVAAGPYAAIAGATAASYPLVAADAGRFVRVVVTASNGAGSGSSASSAVGPVAPAPGTPITVTLAVSGSGEDGDVTREDVGGVYPPGGAFYSDSARDVVFVRKGRPSWGVSVMVGLVRFDTGVLPDNAVVTSASLRLRLLQKVGVNNPSLVAEWYGAANWPIESGDWAAAVGTDAHAGTAWAGLVANADNDLSLQNLGSISLTGATGLRLGLSGGSPTGDNYLSFASWDHASLAEPRLLVTYTLPGAGSPVASAPPVVSGTAGVGEVLSASTGTWSNSPTGYAYRWERADVAAGPYAAIAGATAASYPLVAADAGRFVRVVVTASNGAGSGSSASSAVGPVAPAPGTPITVTLAVSGSGEDGDVEREDLGGAYPPAGAFYSEASSDQVFVRKGRPSWGVSVMVGLVRFDTGVLPDNAVVTSASLRLRLLQKVGVNNPSLVAEWYGAANWPIESGDWAAAVGTDAHAGTAWAGLVANADNDLSLQNLGSISLTGATGLRLGLSGGSPTGDNYLSFASWDHASLAEPRLLVTYTLP